MKNINCTVLSPHRRLLIVGLRYVLKTKCRFVISRQCFHDTSLLEAESAAKLSTFPSDGVVPLESTVFSNISYSNLS